MRSTTKRILIVSITCLGSLLFHQHQAKDVNHHSRALTIVGDHLQTAAEKEYDLPGWANSWCRPPDLPPLPYESCNTTDTINVIKLEGGMTNALKFVLLGTILSFEEGRCLYIDESQSHLNNNNGESFINRYFEPIGLQRNNKIIQNAYRHNSHRIVHRNWRELWESTRARRMYQSLHDIDMLHLNNIEGHMLKKIVSSMHFCCIYCTTILTQIFKTPDDETHVAPHRPRPRTGLHNTGILRIGQRRFHGVLDTPR